MKTNEDFKWESRPSIKFCKGGHGAAPWSDFHKVLPLPRYGCFLRFPEMRAALHSSGSSRVRLPHPSLSQLLGNNLSLFLKGSHESKEQITE